MKRNFTAAINFKTLKKNQNGIVFKGHTKLYKKSLPQSYFIELKEKL